MALGEGRHDGGCELREGVARLQATLVTLHGTSHLIRAPSTELYHHYRWIVNILINSILINPLGCILFC